MQADPGLVRRIKLTLAYDGTGFHGWQIQPDVLTIQGLLERVLSQIEGSKVHISGSGRTDAGVHALGQVAAFSFTNPIPTANLRRAINRLLPASVRVLNAEETDPSFHPRRDAIAKTYQYRIWRGEICPPFERRYVHHHPYPLDVDRMIEAANEFEGTHDFSAFASTDDKDALGHSKVRTIFSSTLAQVRHTDRLLTRAARQVSPNQHVASEPRPPGSGSDELGLESSGELLIYRVRGSGFLKHMVRNMAGTLLEAGKGNLDREGVAAYLKTGCRDKAGPRVPASGLFLISVEYGTRAREAATGPEPAPADA